MGDDGNPITSSDRDTATLTFKCLCQFSTDLLSVFLSLFDKLRKSFILRTIVIQRAQPGPKNVNHLIFPYFWSMFPIQTSSRLPSWFPWSGWAQIFRECDWGPNVSLNIGGIPRFHAFWASLFYTYGTPDVYHLILFKDCAWLHSYSPTVSYLKLFNDINAYKTV